MFCPNCGSSVTAGQPFCNACGFPLSTGTPPYSPQTTNIYLTEQSLPPQYRPLGAWAYFGYMILFSIPIVGLILLIVFSFSDENINRRNFARSYWCVLVLAAILFVIALLLGLFFGVSNIFDF